MIEHFFKRLDEEARPSPEEVQRLAYLIYEREGRPTGRDQQHWFEAEAYLWALKLMEKMNELSLVPEVENAEGSASDAASQNPSDKPWDIPAFTSRDQSFIPGCPPMAWG